MNVAYFIAKRLSLGKEAKRYVSRSIVRFSSVSIALGLAVMIITVSVVTGFKKKITYKVFGFGSHVQVVNFDSNSSYETVPIVANNQLAEDISKIPDIKHIQVFATKPGIIKTLNDVQGVIVKGVDKDFDWTFFKENLVAGEIFSITDTVTNNILISKKNASLLKLKPGDEFIMYFVQKENTSLRFRRFKVSGIYETGLEEFDKIIVLADIKHIQRLNNWKAEEITGYEIALTNFRKIDEVHRKTMEMVGLKLNPDGSGLKVTDIKEKNTQIFDWINLQNMNVWIILALMLLVAGFNMISGLIILILERTNMIGLLKSLGASNKLIAKIFLYQSAFLIIKGLAWGNLIGVSICWLQYRFEFIQLDQSSYFLDSVPINLNIFYLLLLNIGTALLTLVMLTVPSLIISRIKPESSLRFN